MKVKFFVEGEPKAQPRTKAYRRGPYIGFYNPKSADDWKLKIYEEAKNYIFENPIDEPIRCDITFFMPIRSGDNKKKNKGKIIPHCKKPDKDNLEKAVLDTLSRSKMWRDDALIYSGNIKKVYDFIDYKIGCLIEIETFDDENECSYITSMEDYLDNI